MPNHLPLSRVNSDNHSFDYEVPYWRLSSLYFFYFMAVGVILPYWGLYLDDLGFSSTQIGVIVAIPMFTKVIAPNLWGWLADTSGRYLLIIQIGAVFTVVFFSGVLVSEGYWGILLFTAAFSFFWNAILPQFEVLTLDALGTRAHNYSRIRLWGSFGFIVAVVLLGVIFEQFGVRYLPPVMWFLLLLIAISTLALPKIPSHQHCFAPGDFFNSLFKRSVVWFLTASILLNISHGVFYGFYSLHMAANGYSKTAIGLLWAVGVIAEVVLFLKVPKIFAHIDLWQCYLVGLMASVVRWILVACLPEHSAVMIFTQLLHALTFALTHAVAIEVVRRSFKRNDRGKAQAMYSAVCFGAGGALGAYLSGIIWGFGAAYCFLFASVISLFGVLSVFFGMRSFKGVH